MKLVPKGTLVLRDRMTPRLFNDPKGTITGLSAWYVESHKSNFVPTVIDWIFNESAIIQPTNTDSAVVLIRLPSGEARYNGFWVNPANIKEI